MWREKGRAAIYELGGIYLLFMSYNIFKNRAESTGGEHILIWIFIIFFVVAGLGMIGMGLYQLHKNWKEENSNHAPAEEKTENTIEEASLKEKEIDEEKQE